MATRLVVAGDSWTYGSEIRDPKLTEDVKDWDQPNDAYRLPRIWPTKLGALMGSDTEVINLSYPAASNDRIVRHLTGWLTQEYLYPGRDTSDLFVVVGLTSPERKDFYYKDESLQNWITIWPMWDHSYAQPPLREFGKLYATHMWNEEEYVHRYIQQVFYLQTLFKQYGIKHLFFQAFYQHQTMHIKDWRDDPYNRHYNGQPDRPLWDMIDPVRFMNKNDSNHSFHHYITSRDTSPHKQVSIVGMHPSETGHTWWAERLHQYCGDNNLW
jgi:hypothetical protein